MSIICATLQLRKNYTIVLTAHYTHDTAYPGPKCKTLNYYGDSANTFILEKTTLNFQSKYRYSSLF